MSLDDDDTADLADVYQPLIDSGEIWARPISDQQAALALIATGECHR